MSLGKPRLVGTPRIVQPSKGRLIWWLLPFFGLLLLWSWQMFELGRQQGSSDEQISTDLRSRYVARIKNLEQEVESLRLEAAGYERASQIDRDAARRVQRDLLALQTERSELRREVALLRGLVASNSSLRIKDVRLSPNSAERSYTYSFTVAQLKEQKSATQGQILIKISGEKNGKAQELELKDLTAGEQTSVKMRFRHFQNVEGTLSLPEAFEPQSLIIEVKPKTKNAKPIEQAFDWVRLVS